MNLWTLFLFERCPPVLLLSKYELPDIVTSKHLPTRHDRTICNFSIELPKVGHTDFDILVQIIQDSALQYRQRKKDPWHQLTLPSVLLLRWRPSHPKKLSHAMYESHHLARRISYDFLENLLDSFGTSFTIRSPVSGWRAVGFGWPCVACVLGSL